jgi:hypothetical protein
MDTFMGLFTLVVKTCTCIYRKYLLRCVNKNVHQDFGGTVIQDETEAEAKRPRTKRGQVEDMNNGGQEDPQPGPSGMQPAKSKANKGKAKRKRNQDEEEDENEEDMEDGDIRCQVKLSRIHNRDRK